MSFKFSFILDPSKISSVKTSLSRASSFNKWFDLRIIYLMFGKALEKFNIKGIYFYFSTDLSSKRSSRSMVLTLFTYFITCFLLCPHLVILFIISS